MGGILKWVGLLEKLVNQLACQRRPFFVSYASGFRGLAVTSMTPLLPLFCSVHFTEYDFINILHVSDSEWWFVCDGETGTSGYAPSNYLRPLVKHGELGSEKTGNQEDNTSLPSKR